MYFSTSSSQSQLSISAKSVTDVWNKTEDIKKFSMHFHNDEVQTLKKIHRALVASKGEMDLDNFSDVIFSNFRITDDKLLRRLFCVFDTNKNGKICEDEWVVGLNIFLLGNLEESIRFCFDVYDITGDQNLQKEELQFFLSDELSALKSWHAPERELEELIVLTMDNMDVTNDSNISFDDYRATVLEYPHMLQCLGQCLPIPHLRDAFLLNLSSKVLNHTIKPCDDEQVLKKIDKVSEESMLDLRRIK
ncbi:hypothetical protein GJ496_008549 [Pomphorhynchus laevis]|nr:hypothetical protein GJ496_008549 [Pomphorhynchus laevis]